MDDDNASATIIKGKLNTIVHISHKENIMGT
jgi:hypothetical protein